MRPKLKAEEYSKDSRVRNGNDTGANIKAGWTNIKLLMFAVIIAAVITMSATAVMNDSPAMDAAGGTGNPDTSTSWYDGGTIPGVNYYISNADQLAGLAQIVNDSANGYDFNGDTITLTDNIDLSIYGTSNTSWNSGNGWIPIGDGTLAVGTPGPLYLFRFFDGTFDGDHHVITNLTIDTSGDYASLFGCCDRESTIKNLGIVDDSIKGGGISTYAAGVVAYDYGTIQHCYNTGTITCSNYAGGVVAANYGPVLYCYNTGTIKGGYDVGGVAAGSCDTIKYCYNTGDIYDDGSLGVANVGGIVGDNHSGACVISNCYNTGNIFGGSNDGSSICYVGGINGWNETGDIQNCYNTGNVICTSDYLTYVSGVVGANESGTVQNCYNTGSISGINLSGGTVSVGGMAGWSTTCQIENCYNTGSISGTGSSGSTVTVGGMVGWSEGDEVRNCYNTGPVTGTCDDLIYAGGVVGYSNYSTVSDCYFNSDNCAVGMVGIGIDNNGNGDMIGLTTAQMIDPNVLRSGGYMDQLGGAFDKRDADPDYCYYPELAVFSGLEVPNSIPNSVQTASQISAEVDRILPLLSAVTDPIDEGQTLNDSNLDVTAKDPTSLGPVGGTFDWNDGSITPHVSDSGITEYGYTFTPSSELYKIATGKTTVIVNQAAVPSVKGYDITASSDSNSNITPNGMITVQSGDSVTFTFSASPGYLISSVTVDSKPLPQDKISQGYYTFSNVISNHSIDVASSVDQGTSADPDDSNNGGDSGNGSGSSDGHGSSFLWWALGLIILLILIGLLIWFLLFYRRYYDVIKVSGSNVNIIGDEKVRRKSEYRFSIDGVFSGKVSYRVGEDGQWKTLLPNTGGEYTIPKGEITDNVTIEVR